MIKLLIVVIKTEINYNVTLQGEDKGEAFEGPKKDRSCTDVICVLFFGAYIFGMV